MRNIQIIISYRGTSYCGWQVQPNGVTIQEVIIRAIKELTGETVNLTGSGRTDAGVHALGQSANFLPLRPSRRRYGIGP
jgi:Pseudouridylate synthase